MGGGVGDRAPVDATAMKGPASALGGDWGRSGGWKWGSVNLLPTETGAAAEIRVIYQ